MQYLPIIHGDYLGSIIVCDLGHSVIYANKLYIVLNFQVSIIWMTQIPGKYSVVSSYSLVFRLFIINYSILRRNSGKHNEI